MGAVDAQHRDPDTGRSSHWLEPVQVRPVVHFGGALNQLHLACCDTRRSTLAQDRKVELQSLVMLDGVLTVLKPHRIR